MSQFFTVAFVAFGVFLLYVSVDSFWAQMPIAGLLSLASAMLSFIAGFCIRKRRWGFLFVVFYFLYALVDASIVRRHFQE